MTHIAKVSEISFDADVTAYEPKLGVFRIEKMKVRLISNDGYTFCLKCVEPLLPQENTYRGLEGFGSTGDR